MDIILQKLVAKPDQLIKRRGKLGLIKVKADFNEAKQWIQERIGKDQKVSKMSSNILATIIGNNLDVLSEKIVRKFFILDLLNHLSNPK